MHGMDLARYRGRSRRAFPYELRQLPRASGQTERAQGAYAYPTTRQYHTFHSFPIEEQLMLLL